MCGMGSRKKLNRGAGTFPGALVRDQDHGTNYELSGTFAVHVQHADCCATDIGQPRNAPVSFNPKMSVPRIIAGIKERSELIG